LSSSCHEQAAALILTKVLFWQVAMTLCFPWYVVFPITLTMHWYLCV
jgi:hypothetical protein